MDLQLLPFIVYIFQTFALIFRVFAPLNKSYQFWAPHGEVNRSSEKATGTLFYSLLSSFKML